MCIVSCHITLVSLVNAPASLNSSGVRTQNSLCGHNDDWWEGLGMVLHNKNSLPASGGSPLCCCQDKEHLVMYTIVIM